MPRAVNWRTGRCIAARSPCSHGENRRPTTAAPTAREGVRQIQRGHRSRPSATPPRGIDCPNVSDTGVSRYTFEYFDPHCSSLVSLSKSISFFPSLSGCLSWYHHCGARFSVIKQYVLLVFGVKGISGLDCKSVATSDLHGFSDARRLKRKAGVRLEYSAVKTSGRFVMA